MTCEKCKGLQALETPEMLVVPCSCVPELERWRAAAIPDRYLEVPKSTLPSAEIPKSRFIWGDVGRGKTRAAVGILKRWAKVRMNGFFLELPVLKDLRLQTVRAGRFEALPGDLEMAAPFVVADDLGVKRAEKDFWLEFLETFIRVRYNAKATTVFTSNMPLEEIEQTHGSWISGRIAEMCGDRIHEMTGQDWRVEKAA